MICTLWEVATPTMRWNSSTNIRNQETSFDPFFLYYPSNSNHGPHTVDEEIVWAENKRSRNNDFGRSCLGRLDYIYENDVALGRLLDFLEKTKDPRRLAVNSLKTLLSFSLRIMERK